MTDEFQPGSNYSCTQLGVPNNFINPPPENYESNPGQSCQNISGKVSVNDNSHESRFPHSTNPISEDRSQVDTNSTISEHNISQSGVSVDDYGEIITDDDVAKVVSFFLF